MTSAQVEVATHRGDGRCYACGVRMPPAGVVCTLMLCQFTLCGGCTLRVGEELVAAAPVPTMRRRGDITITINGGPDAASRRRGLLALEEMLRRGRPDEPA